MQESSAISARCAALSTSTARVISDISQFARKVRDARHDLNAINNDLLIIRTALGIAQDDFSNPRSVFPFPLLDAFDQILDSCDATSDRLHRTFLRLACSLLPQEDWQTCRNGVLTSMRQDLEGSKTVLELSLDYLALYLQIPGQETTIDSFLGGHVSSMAAATDELLKKTDTEEIQVNNIARERLPSLLQAIRLLRSCITAASRNKIEAVPSTKAPRPDSLEPSLGESRRSVRHAPLHENTMSSSPSSGKGINTWLASIPQSEDAQPLRHSRIVEMSKPKKSRRSRSKPPLREVATLSRSTFYTEDGQTSPTLTVAAESRLKKTRSWSSGITAQYATHSSSTTKVPSNYSPSVASSNMSVRHKKITCDRIAIAKENRKNLDVSARVGVDRILSNLPTEATATDVEKILWEGANPMVTHPDFGYFFIRAAYEMSPDILRLLLDFGADISKTLPPPNMYHSVMHAAALGGRVQTMEYLVSLGYSIDAPDFTGQTPLILAAKTPGCFHAAKYLLDQGADVNHETEDGETPLYLALMGKSIEGRERSRMIEMLQQYGADGDVHVGDDGRGERDKKGRMVLGIT